jgi:SAM-dependent methyltransferase
MAIIFQADSLRLLGNVTLTDNISANPYDPLARQVLSETTAQEGWSLDCGAGSRERRMEHVINLEIVDYPSTDIISIGEALPFEDNVFDTVVSFAVLEHVRDPFSCAREMVRVAKPGAKIVCSVPFLQPVHGYPGHYYNMTQQGLINLFSDSAEIVDCHVPPHGHPIYAVNWLVREYLAGLPAAERAQFAAYTLGEIATTPPAQFLGSPLTSSLSVEAQGLTACLNTVVAVKR